MEKIKTEIDQTEAEIQKTDGTWVLSKETKERQKELESKLGVLIPSEKDYPELIYKIARLAKDLNIQDITFKGTDESNPNVLEGKREAAPETPVLPGTDIGYFFIGLSFHARFRDLACLLQKIQEIGRFIEIDSLVVKRELPMISVNMLIIAYYNRGQKSEAGEQKSEVRDQKSDLRKAKDI